MGALVSNGKAHRKQNSVKGRTVLRALDSSLVSQHWPRGSFCGSSGERESDLLNSPCGKRAAKGKRTLLLAVALLRTFTALERRPPTQIFTETRRRAQMGDVSGCGQGGLERAGPLERKACPAPALLPLTTLTDNPLVTVID